MLNIVLFFPVPKGPEYRLHALVFLSRSLAILALYHYERVHHMETPIYEANWAIVLVEGILTLLHRLVYAMPVPLRQHCSEINVR